MLGADDHLYSRQPGGQQRPHAAVIGSEVHMHDLNTPGTQLTIETKCVAREQSVAIATIWRAAHRMIRNCCELCRPRLNRIPARTDSEHLCPRPVEFAGDHLDMLLHY